MSVFKKIVTLLRDRSGATVIEYGLMAALLALAIIGGATAVGGTTNDTFTDVRDGFSASTAP